MEGGANFHDLSVIPSFLLNIKKKIKYYLSFNYIFYSNARNYDYISKIKLVLDIYTSSVKLNFLHLL